MPQRSREAYLWDIADSRRAASEFVRGRSLHDYENDRMLCERTPRCMVGNRRFPSMTDFILVAECEYTSFLRGGEE